MAIREVHILHHTHVDIGYTDLAPILWDKHVAYLDQALDLCTQTDDYPEEAQFRWPCEFSWAMLQFCRNRPARIPEMVERLKQGRIELAALYIDPTELMDKRAYEVALRPAEEMAGEHGFDLTTIMTTDVPGAGWSLADVMAEHQLPYLMVAANTMVGKPLAINDRPFYWVGPRGGRTLVWNIDWRKGWYGAGHVLGMPAGLATCAPRVEEYVASLESEGYPWEVLPVHYAADNYPPDGNLPDLVRGFNEQHDTVRLRLSTNRDFLERLLELHGSDFPSYQLAWPDCWSEGLGSAVFEVALARETHCRLRRLEALQAKLGDARDLWPIWEDLLLFDEHTWGASNSGVEPYSYNSRASWVHKTRHIYLAHDGARRLEAELAKSLAPAPSAQEAAEFVDETVRGPASGPRRLSLFNPLDVPFTGPIAVAGMASEVTTLALASGVSADVQCSPATALRPAQGRAVVRLKAGAAATANAVSDAARLAAPAVIEGCSGFENDFFVLQFSEDGQVLSLVDKASGREMIDRRAPWGFGEVIRETITSPEDRAAVWERGYLEIPYGYRRSDANFQRQGSIENSWIARLERGPVYDAVIVESELPYLRRIETEVRLWRELPWIEFEVRLDKQAHERYEGIYVAFPFKLEGARGLIQSCDAVFEAETQQLPGTGRDFYAVHDYAAMVADDGWAAVCPVEAPLVQMGALTFGRWADHLRIDRACIYPWLLNNFWYTNFPGVQQGELTFRFAIATGAGAYDAQRVQALADVTRVGLSVGVVE